MGQSPSCVNNWGGKVVPIQYPVSTGSSFNAVVDVLKMKMYRWKPEGGVPEVLEIPAEEMDKAMELHQGLGRIGCRTDDMLMEKFFEEGTLSEDDMRAGIRAGLVIRGCSPYSAYARAVTCAFVVRWNS